MADYINNVAAADAYTKDLTLGPNFDARSLVITVANNPSLMQFAVGKVGNWRWTDEREFFSIPQSFKVGRVIGVKFRNANPGQVARILATLSGDDDIEFESGLPFVGLLSASGAISVSGTLTGFVSGAGAVLAGTGFGAARLGVGQYQITPTPPTPFAVAPVVLAMVNDNTGPVSVAQVANVSAAAWQINIVDNITGALVDKNFYFYAVPMV